MSPHPVRAEKTAARAALAGWREMLVKAVQAEGGRLEEQTVRDRIKSLDAAWVRFDKAHYSLLNTLSSGESDENVESVVEIEQDDWEKQMEEYCRANKGGLAALKKAGLTTLKVGI